ncbi:MAG: hypothetical protein VKK04_23755 [Synechococcales bacterium]|nr:hypothetical protein [Synechococcales bacterium]
MKFAVSIINPPNYSHARAVWEVAETVHYGLQALGHDSVLTFETDLGDDRQHITLLPNLLVIYQGALAPNTVLYNLEQVYPGSPWLQAPVMDHFLQYPLWDYSTANIHQFRQMGVSPVQHVPIGYVPELSRIPSVPEAEDIDVLFYGSINERRHQVLEALRKKNVNVEAIFGLYGQERDRYIARSKIVLNVHFYPAKVFEIVRVSYLLANRRFVISERGSDSTEEPSFASGIVFSDYENLVDTCLDFLNRPLDRQRIAQAGFELMSQRSEVAYLENALQSLQQRSDPEKPFVFQKDLYRKRQAAYCLKQEQYAEAIALYEQSLETDPTCTLSYWNLGLALLFAGDDMAAQLCWAASLSRSEEKAPEFDEAQLLLFLHQAVEQYQSMQRPDLAERIRQQILELGFT